MRRVRCYECGKMYDFDMDDFCPRCGAFNQPPKSTAIDADGSVIRVDGINEKNHAGSFVHEELHEEAHGPFQERPADGSQIQPELAEPERRQGKNRKCQLGILAGGCYHRPEYPGQCLEQPV